MNEMEIKIKKFIKMKPSETTGDGVCGFLSVPNGYRKMKKPKGTMFEPKTPSPVVFYASSRNVSVPLT